MWRWIIVLTAAALVSCQSQDPIATAPPEPDRLEVSLEISVRPAEQADGLLVKAAARNAGNVAIQYSGFCGLASMEFRCFDPTGAEVDLQEMGDQQLLRCPGFVGPLLPSEEAVSFAYFSGTARESEVPTPLPAGVYRAVASFRYGVSGSTESQSVSAERFFEWQP